jgi:hypothetical protein
MDTSRTKQDPSGIFSLCAREKEPVFSRLREGSDPIQADFF